jgi:hypothetical protein
VPHPFRPGFLSLASTLAFALALSLNPWLISRAAAASAPSIQLLQPGAAGGAYTVGSARGAVQLTATDVDGTIARITWHSDRLDPSPTGACYIDPAQQTVLTWCGMYLMPGVNVITITVEDNDGLTNDAVITLDLQKPTFPGGPTVTFSVPDPEIVFTTSSIMNMNTVMTDAEGFVQWFPTTPPARRTRCQARSVPARPKPRRAPGTTWTSRWSWAGTSSKCRRRTTRATSRPG